MINSCVETLITLMVIQGPPPSTRGKKRAVIDRLFIRGGKGWTDSNEEGGYWYFEKVY